MKKIIFAVILFASALLIMRFIPATQQKQMLIKNKIEHVINYVTYQRNWIKWHPDLKAAWKNDSTSVQTNDDVQDKAFSFRFAGKEIKVKNMSGLQYHIEQTGEDNTADFIVSISPDQNTPYTRVNYAKQTNLLYRLFPGLKINYKADTILGSLRYALEDARSFYGFDITLHPAQEKAYVVKQMAVSKQKALYYLPEMFSAIEKWNKTQGAGSALYYSISHMPLNKDSAEIIAGISLNKIIAGNDSITCMKVPAKQFLVTGSYEGVYDKKNALYSAMSLYMMDHRLPQTSAFFERFEPGKIPTSDSSIVKMELCFPYYKN